MRTGADGRVVLKHPDDYYGFTHAGMTFERLTGIYEPARYRVRALASGRWYIVTGRKSKRYPWRAMATVATPGDGYRAGSHRTLLACAESLARFDRIAYPPPVDTSG